MPRKEKTTGMTISVTDAERKEINDLREQFGGLSILKLVMMLVREKAKALKK